MTFFRQHNVTTSDAQIKYKSRAAQLYRDKLHHLAAQALRLHGTKLFIDAATSSKDEEEPEQEDPDFFENHTAEVSDDGPSSMGMSDVRNGTVQSSITSSSTTSSVKQSVTGVCIFYFGFCCPHDVQRCKFVFEKFWRPVISE